MPCVKLTVEGKEEKPTAPAMVGLLALVAFMALAAAREEEKK
jgi:hypothetical protein